MSAMPGVLAMGLLLPVALLLAGCDDEPRIRGTSSSSVSGVTGCWCADCSVYGTGSKVTKSYNFSGYTGLVLGGFAMDTEVTVGESPSISVTLYENAAEYLDVHVETDAMSSALSLDFATFICNSGAKAVITVTEPLNSVSASSGSLRVDRLTGWVDMSGSGSVTIDVVDGASFIVNSSSSGGLIVHSAQATLNLDVTSSGSGQVILESLTTPTVVVDSSGSGQVHLGSGEATQSVDVSTSGSGQVMLGSLTTTNATISSSGSGGVSGMTSQNLRVQSSGSGGITTSATESFHGSCTGSASVSIAGGARVSGSCR
jgi:hypothetical protein